MAEITIEDIREFIKPYEGQELTLDTLRRELHIEQDSKSWDSLRVIMHRLVEQRVVKRASKKGGVFKIIKELKPVRVFIPGRERRPPFELIFPKDRDTQMEMDFARFIVIREGDLILIPGLSNYGKTTLAMNFCAENIDKNPVLMGNEYTTIDEEPTPRFLNRLDNMDWVEWVDEEGNDKFTLLPVRDDYAEHIVKDRINIIDWINIATGEHYMIGTILDGIKRNLGRGIAIVVIQKAEGADAGRGGQFTKDFADCELLIDKFGTYDVLLTIGKVKEYTKPVVGKTYAYHISKGVKLLDFREVEKCTNCRGQGFKVGIKCETCGGKKYV